MSRQTIILLAILGFSGALLAAAGVLAAIALLYLDTEALPAAVAGRDNQSLVLPESVLNNPTKPESIANSITVTVLDRDQVNVGDQHGSMAELTQLLQTKVEELGNIATSDCAVFVYAQHALPASLVQQVVVTCQNMGFENFILRELSEKPASVSVNRE